MKGRRVLSVLLTDDDYEQIKILAAKKHMSMAALARDFILRGLNGNVTESNIEILAPIIRSQVECCLAPQMERMISLISKTCIQSGAAAYLSADAILKFVPPSQREEVQHSYELARKRAVKYMKNKTYIEE